MMDYSINAKRIFGADDHTSDDEEQLLDENNSDNEGNGGPSVFYKSVSIKDRFKFGYITFYLLGILTLVPWNFFATATNYWMYKFRDIESNNSHLTNKTALQTEFTSYLSITSTAPSLFFLILNIIFSQRLSFQIRIIGSLVIILICFILTTVLVYVDTDKWQNIFFVITMLSATIMNIFSGILQASIWGVASNFPPKYIAATSSGQALGGIFAAIVCIVSLALSASSTTSALIYFSIALITVIGGLIFYKILSLTKFFKFYMLQKTPARELKYDPAEINNVSSAFAVPNISLSRLLQKMWCYGFCIAMCFAVTLSVQPGITVLISSVNGSGDWQTKYFVPVVAFLIFNSWDYIGRILAGILKWPLQKPRLIIIFSFLRIVFVPLILLCNAHPRQNLPVLINNDSYYIAITCLFGFTNGYMTNVIMVNYRSAVDDSEKDVASSLVAVFLGLGCAVGSAMSFLLLKIL